MNQKQIQYFVEVYRKKSVQAAADALYISRQGVSRTIRMLEEELGQPLFQRTAKGLIPTDYAAALMPHAQRLLLEYETIFGMNTLAAQSQSVVTVYALDHLAAYLGSDFILRFHEQYPHIILSLVDTSDMLASEALAAQNCSFAMITGPVDESRFQADPLFYSCYSIRMHRDHPLAQKEILTYDDLADQTIISKGRAYSCFRNEINRHILLPGKKIEILVETTDESIITELLLQNRAVNLGYDYADYINLRPEIVSRRLEEENGEVGGQMVYLLSNPRLQLTRASRIFRSFLLSWFGGDRKQKADGNRQGQ